MSKRAAVQTLISPDEYLEREIASATKHEFVGGSVYAMAGASERHGIVVVNFVVALGNHLPGGCLLFTADMKVRIRAERSTLFYYPDILVTCSPDDRPNPYFREQPMLIIEVLSPSTERTDRTEKFDNYRRLLSLKEYVLADQDMPKVEVLRRRTAWEREAFYPDDTFALESVDLKLSVNEVYRRTDFDPASR